MGENWLTITRNSKSFIDNTVQENLDRACPVERNIDAISVAESIDKPLGPFYNALAMFHESNAVDFTVLILPPDNLSSLTYARYHSLTLEQPLIFHRNFLNLQQSAFLITPLNNYLQNDTRDWKLVRTYVRISFIWNSLLEELYFTYRRL